MADHRMIGKAADLQADGVMGIEQATCLPYVSRVQLGDVIVEKQDPLPAEPMAEDEPKVALGAQV
jgi:hypothetical protein